MNFPEFWHDWCTRQANTGAHKDPKASARAAFGAGVRQRLAEKEAETQRLVQDMRESKANALHGRCACPDDSGSCDWCRVYYGEEGGA